MSIVPDSFLPARAALQRRCACRWPYAFLAALLLAGNASAIVVTAVFHTARVAPASAPSATLVTHVAAWSDATIRRATPDTNDGDSEVIWLTKSFERVLLGFDPVLAVVASNTLSARLYLYNVAGNDGDDADFTWNAHLLTNLWAEDGATWSNRTASALWTRAGGDYSNLVASGELHCQDEEYHAFDITAAVQAYGATRDAYAGVLLRCLADYDPEPCYASVDNVYAAEQLGLWNDAAEQQPFLYAIFDDGTLPDVFPAFFSIRLSNDFQTPILRWTNAALATVLVCTNRYYSTDPADWFVRASNVSSHWADTQAAASPSVYYRLVSAPHGSYLSAYDLAKFSVAIQQADGLFKRENWLSSPLEFVDDAGATVAFKSFDEVMVAMCLGNQAGFATLRDQVQSQEPVGGNTRIATRGNGIWGVDHPSATNWFAHKMYRIVVHQTHSGAAKPLTFVGRVRTNDTSVAAIEQADGLFKRENWVAWPYPTFTSFDAGAIASVLSNQAGFATLRDQVQSQEPVGGNTRIATRGANVWGADNPAATNFFGGAGYRIIIHQSHTGPATNWYVPRPY